MTHRRNTLLCLAFCVLSSAAVAQNAPSTTTSTSPAASRAGCPDATEEVPVQALYGSWDARFDGVPGVATVRFRPHPEYAGSVRGDILRDGAGAQLAGDIDDDGLLTLDESQDGRAISAVWSGAMQPGSCGKEFKGTWRNAIDDSTRPFVLNKTGSGR